MIKAPALRLDRVLLDVDAADCSGALRAITGDLAGCGLAGNPVALHEALAARERTLTTALGAGIAIPHARVSGLGKPLVAFARLAHPIAMGAADGRPVDLIIAIVSPVEDPGEHVKLLAALARRLQDPACLEALRTAHDAAGVRAAFESA